MKTLLISIVALLISPSLLAADYFGRTVDRLDEYDINRFEVEALMHTVSNGSSLAFGPSVNYKWSDINQFTLRTVAPMFGFSEPGDVETTSAQILWRYKVNQNRASLFTEVGVGYNMYRYGIDNKNTNVGSMGTNLGISYSVNNELSVGGIAGFEWTSAIIDRQRVRTSNSDISLYPRLAILIGLQLN